MTDQSRTPFCVTSVNVDCVFGYKTHQIISDSSPDMASFLVFQNTVVVFRSNYIKYIHDAAASTALTLKPYPRVNCGLECYASSFEEPSSVKNLNRAVFSLIKEIKNVTFLRSGRIFNFCHFIQY